MMILNLRSLGKTLALGLVAVVAGVGLSAILHGPAQAQPPLAGGDTTRFNRTSRAYQQPAPNLDAHWARLHNLGDIAFEATFVTAPAPINPGLGPLFNASSCTGCHIKNGRGLPQVGQRVVRVSLAQPLDPASVLPPSHPYAAEAIAPGANAQPVPGIGTQVQEKGIYGVTPEAVVQLTWIEQEGIYGDGSPYTLRSPQIALSRPDGTPLGESVLVSHRIPQPVFGAGLLEAIAAADLLAIADPDDRDGDGISGRPNRVWDGVRQAPNLGRFGWKANTPHLLQQTAAAYAHDMGVTNPLFPAADGSQDIDQATLIAAAVYVQTLAVPARTLLDDPQVQRGERLFAQAQCTACHVPQWRTGPHEIPALAHQIIHPYTDLLLHDLGPGLADHRPDFAASGSEWRTPPLWGVGLAQTVLPYSGFLHDGRARTLEEAILWHGGEAAQAQETFRTMTAADRAALIWFLRSL